MRALWNFSWKKKTTIGKGNGTEDKEIREQLKKIEKRAYRTYRARQSACIRLSQRARAWNWALVAFSTATTVAAIGMLTNPAMYGANGGTLMVCLSVLVLVATLTTTNMDYPGRSRDMFLNYRKIQKIAVEAEELLQTPRDLSLDVLADITNKYQIVLDETENHTEGDYLRHFSKSLDVAHPYFSEDRHIYRRRRRKMALDAAITLLPCGTLALPAYLVVPLVNSLFP